MRQFKLSDCTLLITFSIGSNYIRLYKHPVFDYDLRVKLYNDKPRSYYCPNISVAQALFNSFAESLVKANPIYG